MSALLEQSAVPACVAGEIYDLLVNVCGAREDNRALFVGSLAGGSCEVRLASRLGRGGKLIVRPARRGSYMLRVDYYREDLTPQRDAMWSRVNQGLRRIELAHADELGSLAC